MHSIATIRRLIEQGCSDDEIIDSIDSAEFSDASYGPSDAEDFGGPAYLSDDGYYARNDAADWSRRA